MFSPAKLIDTAHRYNEYTNQHNDYGGRDFPLQVLCLVPRFVEREALTKLDNLAASLGLK